jgi:hypothetical protein
MGLFWASSALTLGRSIDIKADGLDCVTGGFNVGWLGSSSAAFVANNRRFLCRWHFQRLGPFCGYGGFFLSRGKLGCSLVGAIIPH